MNKYLLPYRYRVVGLVLLFIGTIVVIAKSLFNLNFDFLNVSVFALVTDNLVGLQFFKIEQQNLVYHLITIILILGATLLATTKETEELPHFNELRAESITLTFHIMLGILTFSFLFIYGFVLLYLLIFFMFLPQILYFVIFQIKKQKSISK